MDIQIYSTDGKIAYQAGDQRVLVFKHGGMEWQQKVGNVWEYLARTADQKTGFIAGVKKDLQQ